VRDFGKEDILYILESAARVEANPKPTLLAGKVMASLFFEPSTRTRLSFDAAMSQLGGSIIGFSSPGSTSLAKGESLRDTIRMVEAYSDVIVMRHPLDGSARLAAEISRVPVINGGDGTNQHPTQTFLDLYTIRKSKGRLDGLKIGFVGDLKYGRTVHSLSEALRHFNTTMYFISLEQLRMPQTHLDDLKAQGIKYHETSNIHEVIGDLDILYATRIQQERFPDPVEYEKVRGAFVIDKELLREAKSGMRIMHPLPRREEVSADVDETEFALYFDQARNGIPIRQALLALVTGAIQ
jgi:aspartate carbamoyltransferase catalytic subunit